MLLKNRYMAHLRKTVVLHEANYPRHLLYGRALEALGVTVVSSRTSATAHALLRESSHVLAVLSFPEETRERQQFLDGMRRLHMYTPLVVLDTEPFNSEDFSALPVQAHFRRNATSLTEVVSRIAAILHME